MKLWLKHYDSKTQTTLDYPDIAVSDMLDESAKRYPNNILTLFYAKTATYSQIKNNSNSLASFLQEAGIGKGDRVAVLLPNCPGFLIAYYGILKTGASAVLLNPLYTETELEYQLKDSEAKGIITLPMFANKIVSINKTLNLQFIIISQMSHFMSFPFNLIVGFKEKQSLHSIQFNCDSVSYMNNIINYYPDNMPSVDIDTRSEAVMIYSGGTTGVAKGIKLSHQAIVSNAYQISAWGHLNQNERILAVLPLFHGYGMNVCMNSSVMSGMSIVLLPKFNAKEMAKTIHKYKPTLTAAVPTILIALSNLPNINSYDFTSLKAVWVGAAPLTKTAKEEFENKAACRVIEGYGLTESVTAIMANPYLGKHKVGSVGLPFPDVDAKIISLKDGKTELQPGQQGEIILKTPTIMIGYHNKKKETKETIKDGWLYTGDIGYMDREGYFYITDRKKDLIIVGGFNVFPREIDEIISQHPKVKEGISVGIPDNYKGEKIKAFVVLKDKEEATEDELKAYFKKYLAPYKIPSEVEFRSSLPKSAIGKILRRALREEEIKKMREK